jgi:hypothetical protein
MLGGFGDGASSPHSAFRKLDDDNNVYIADSGGSFYSSAPAESGGFWDSGWSGGSGDCGSSGDWGSSSDSGSSDSGSSDCGSSGD